MPLSSVALRFLRQFLNWPYVALRYDVRSATYASLASYCEQALRNILRNKLRLLTCYTKLDVTAPALTKLL